MCVAGRVLGVHGGGVCQRGACVAGGVCVAGGMCGGGHAWQEGVCGRGHAWWGCVWHGGACVAAPPPHQILRDTVNERAVRILLECILVSKLHRATSEVSSLRLIDFSMFMPYLSFYLKDGL